MLGYSMEAYALRYTGPSGVLWSDITQSDLAAYASPAFANNVVYFGDSSGVAYAIDALNGNQLWTFTDPNVDAINASPAVANGIVFFGVEDNNVYAFDAANGNELWYFPTGNMVDSSPSIANGVVYIGSEDDNVYAFGLANPPENSAAQAPALSSLHPDPTLKLSQSARDF